MVKEVEIDEVQWSIEECLVIRHSSCTQTGSVANSSDKFITAIVCI